MNKQEFRDAIKLRYNWSIEGIAKYCACGSINDVVHTLSCKKGGYVSLRHNALRDTLANMMRQVCKDVTTEPSLIPIESNNFSNARTTSADGARLDISACGVGSTFEHTFFDVRVCHPFAASNVVTSLEDLYKQNKQEKCALYEERVREVEKGSFVPLVFLTSGGAGPACTETIKRLATLIADKKGECYAHVMKFVRTKLRFSLLKSTLISIRGVRGKPAKEPKMEGIEYNLIQQKGSYDA